MLEQVFANLATGFAESFGAPFEGAAATWPGSPTYDTGGSIVTPGVPVSLACKAQFDAATEAMRRAPDFLQTDVRIIVLAASLAGVLDSAAKIVVTSGANAGTWALMAVTRDPAGIGYECRGRKL